MSALDRFDDWAGGLDDILDATGAGEPARGLEELYDPATLAAIDARHEPPSPPAGWRSGVAAGAMVVGLVTGAREVFEPGEQPVVEVEQARPAPRLEPVSVHLAWGAPAASIAVVRPWLV